MRLFYLVAAHNEERQLESLVARLENVVRKHPGSKVALIDNGSVDGTWERMRALVPDRAGWLSAHRETGKGMGLAFRRGLAELSAQKLTPEDWIVFAAADLPFGFSDLDELVLLQPEIRRTTVLCIGSKAHPRSIVRRDFKRRVGTAVFRLLRRLVLGLKTQDTQGSLFLRGDLIGRFADFRSDDAFFAVEIVDRAERLGGVIEMPVRLEAELRPSKFSVVKDGWKSFAQLLRYRREQAAHARSINEPSS